MSDARYFANWPATVLMLRGADRTKIIHNLCTADVSKLTPGMACEAFVTNVKGHVAAHSVVCCLDEAMAVVLLAADAAQLATHFDKYIILEDAQVTVSDVQPLLLVGGKGIASPTCFKCTLADEAWIDLSGDTARAAELGYREASPQEFDALRVASCWPLAGVDFGEGTLPQELDRDALAISFTKGCYLGQETVARLDAIGHVNKQLVRVVATGDAPLAAGIELTHEGKPVGQITTAAPYGDGSAGLAIVRQTSNATGTTLDSSAGTVQVERRVAPTA